ncbi:MAG: TetR/AcrR family transcriptional regulator [Dyella sp.]
MRVSKEQASKNRQRVLDLAAQRFRERGFDGIGVAELMQQAGLTHGGFYGQFASKDALMGEACAQVMRDSMETVHAMAAKQPDEPWQAIYAGYLSEEHRQKPGTGCLLAALGSELARQAPATRQALTTGFASMAALLAGYMPGATPQQQRQQALAAYAGMIGAQICARAVDDPALATEILQASAALLPQAKPTPSPAKGKSKTVRPAAGTSQRKA